MGNLVTGVGVDTSYRGPLAADDSMSSLIALRDRTYRARMLFRRARCDGFAVGAFNVDNFETLKAIAQAAAATAAPVLFEVSASEVAILGLSNLRVLVDNAVTDLGIEAYLNLDHAPSVDLALAAIEAGFELIHIDLGQAGASSVEEIEAGTREVVRQARSTGAMVEAELCGFAGSSTMHRSPIDQQQVAATLTDPDAARSFVETTGVDTFAVAIGNLHGRYLTQPRLDLERLACLRAVLGVNLSLHGGSGIPDDQLRAAVAGGISKVNVNTDLRHAYRTTLERQLKAFRDEDAVVKLMPPVIDAVQDAVEARIRVFGGDGRAMHWT
jgi:fructose-bisphosphate aldolase class II